MATSSRRCRIVQHCRSLCYLIVAIDRPAEPRMETLFQAMRLSRLLVCR